jgi:hypothetical protein
MISSDSSASRTVRPAGTSYSSPRSVNVAGMRPPGGEAGADILAAREDYTG